MTFDLIMRNGNLPDGRTGIDIGCRDGRIVAVEPRLQAEAGREVDATGRLVSPPFVDIHFHLDATLSVGQPRFNRSGTLLEGIALWGEQRPLRTVEAVAERALRYCDLAVAQGLLAIRTHVDVCDERLVGVEALLDVRDKVRDYLDLQIVAFPQDGYFRSPIAAANLERALDRGVDVVGGIPHFERTMEEGNRSVVALCEIAAARGLRVDLHCDETDDPLSRHVETLAAEAVRLGLRDRVSGSHLTSMHSMDNYYASKLIPLIAESGMHCIPNPLANINLQGRSDTYPKRRGLMRIPELRAKGVNIALGQDSCMDPWYVFGNADMLDVAHMATHAAHMISLEEIRFCFEAITTNAARAFGLEDYGLAPGCHADFVLLDARDPIEAIRLRADRLAVVRRGRVLAETPARETMLDLPGRAQKVSVTGYAPFWPAP
ncbi:MAG: amidohydrolase family protein [Aurantimonas endophytica]|uniref:Cytosine deaminase n=1 Tax=Aurantimonas endophytica TaxID=1522175 RepID=A0A7W6HBJ9_9HYPH|nr:amidohydrolase family protein [Aurantimonas endophytica]MBB4002056.1 cytosine deaminase [Aurantimonas endophytica]MCO6402312.1 amidohydrolase family protein [Aurantimonas endophytica]